MDETSVPYGFGQARGNVTASRVSKTAVAQVSRSELRGAVTHVAFATHDSAVQARLPQVIIGNTRKFTPGLLAAVMPQKPANVVLIRQKTAWNTTTLMLHIIEILGATMQNFPQYQAVLVLDTASCHTAPRVVRAASAQGIWFSFIPAKLTFLLQPLDTHIFASYKVVLKKMYLQARSTGHGTVTSAAWLEVLFHMCTKFLRGRKWKAAFEQTGMLGDRSRDLSKDIQMNFPGAVGFNAPPVLPSCAQLQCLMPRGTSLPYVDLWWKPEGRGRRLALVWGGARVRARL